MLAKHSSHVTNKRAISLFPQGYGYQTWQGDGLWQKTTMRKVTSVFNYIIICNHVANRKRYIDIFKSLAFLNIDISMALHETQGSLW